MTAPPSHSGNRPANALSAQAIGPRHTDLDTIVASLRLIPTRYRVFAKSETHARQVHALPPDLLAAAVEAGLPSVGTGAHRLYDDRDLANLSAALGRRSVWYLAQLGFRAALVRVAAGTPATFDVTMQAACPFPGHRGACDVELMYTGIASHHEPSRGATGRLTGAQTMRIHLPGWTCPAPAPVRAVLSCLDDAEYLQLPPELSRDLEFFDQTGKADCMLAAAVLLREARRRAVPARSAFGLLLAPPFAGLHTWIEFRTDEGWVAFDPHLIRLMEKAKVLSPGQWPHTASLSAVLLRLAPINTSIGRHLGNQTHVTHSMKEIG